MICIYDAKNETFTNNGDAVLLPIECRFVGTINGGWSLSLTHPNDNDGRYKHILEGAVVKVNVDAVDFLGKTLYRISSIKRGLHETTAIAYPIALDCTYDVPVGNFSARGTGTGVGLDLQELTNKYDLYIEPNDTVKNVHWEDTNLNAIFGSEDNSIIKIFGGELYYRNYELKVYNYIGNQNEDDRHRVIYGKNISNIDYSRDESGVITRVYPISKDGIKLNGTGYIDSARIDIYPFVRAKYLTAPYQLVDTSRGSTTNTAALTTSIQTQIQTLADTLSRNLYSQALQDRSYEREYIKQIREDIIEAVQNNCLQNISHEKLYSLVEKAIKSGMSWMKDIEKSDWSWHQGSGGWWYGADNSDYAKNQWCYIDKKWCWFNSDGYWVEKWDDGSGEWDWIQTKDSAHWWYGNNKKYYAHNEWVYETVNGELKYYWIDEEGWYREEYTGVSGWTWHAWGDGWWFGEEGASMDDNSKFAHDQWIWIDHNYYFFDSTGYCDPANIIYDYAWDWQEDNQWYWFGNSDKSFGSQWLESQWSKIDNEWYKFDSNGYRIESGALHDACVSYFVTGMASLKTLCETLRDEAYTLLYNNMTSWVNDTKYTKDGIDKPKVTINISVVDLQKSQEYINNNYEWLETIRLGDKVRCEDRDNDIYTYERVVSIDYDCIRGVNNSITIGVPDTTAAEKMGVSANGSPEAVGGYDMSIIEGEIDDIETELRSKQDRLTAGNHINITNNVISAYGFGNANYRELKKSEYDALPDTKLTDNIIYFIKPYEEYTDDNIVVRVYEDGTTIWYFNDFEYYGGQDHYAVPARLEQFLPTPPSSDTYSYMTSSYEIVSGEQSQTQSGWIGFLMNYSGQEFTSVRSWNMSLNDTNNGHFNARLIIGADTQGGTGYRQQITEYIAPENDDYGKPYGHIILNGNAYTSDSSGSGVSYGTEPPSGGGKDGELYIKLDSNNEKVAEYLYIINQWVLIDGEAPSDYYLNHGLVATSAGYYTTCNLDKPMENGTYSVSFEDYGTTHTGTFTWSGTTVTETIDGFELEVTSSTAGFTYYSGAYRDIYCDIVRIA